jgi:hypothetical protein
MMTTMGVFERVRSSFSKWMRKSAERVARRFYEGPEPPPRLFDEIMIFEKLHPCPTQEQWRAFVTGSIANAYRDGYIRGYEHHERLPTSSEFEQQKWLEAEAHRHDWSLWQGLPSSEESRRRFEEQAADPFAHLTPEERLRAFAELGRASGSFRVVWPGQDDPMPWRKDVEPGA